MSAVRKKNFTLIEMLCVVAVIGILMGILLPVINSIRVKGKIAKAKSEAMAIVAAIKAYEQAYGILPIPSGSQNKLDKDQYRIMMEILTGVDGPDGAVSGQSSPTKIVNNDDIFNARKIRFLDVPANYGNTTGAATGTTTGAEKGDYMDPWNNIYQICIDQDFDNIVYTVTGTTAGSGLTLNGTVFVYSRGPNGVDDLGKNAQFGDTGKDDVCSWR